MSQAAALTKSQFTPSVDRAHLEGVLPKSPREVKQLFERVPDVGKVPPANMHIITDERCTTYEAYGHPERPARILGTLDLLRQQTDLALTWQSPAEVGEKAILRAHSKEHLHRVDTREEAFDGDTPWHKDIHLHARRSAGGALKALELARRGGPVFSLLRPPGHHATPDRAMGFCYLNGIAIAALEALATGAKRVAVFDFDVHHGNGTEAILLNHPHTAFYSIHQHPCYPGTGTANVGDNCYNFPLPPQTPRADYRKTLSRALEELGRFKPEVVAVSAGFDAYAHDPLAQETLEEEDFHWLGEAIRQLGVTTFSVLEGGYSRDLPKLVLAYLKGLSGK
jgi:acetoin utilization deacetylase AcuC-like enzyme